VRDTGRIAAGSIAIGLAVLLLKGAAWWVTGSAALYSDALESVVNVAGSGIAYWALWLAAKPADANHPFGHGKVEFFSAVIEGGMVIAAAVLILQHAWAGWLDPVPLEAPLPGLAMNAAATVLNAIWAAVLLRAGGRRRSPALLADGRHLQADVVTSIAIAAGVGLVFASGRLVLDPLLAAAAAAYILWSGTLMIRQSVAGLMDGAPDGAVVERIRALVAEHAAGALEAHDLRTRHAGQLTFLQFHLVVPGSMTVAEAHAICDRIEDALEAEMGELQITIHVEPEGKAHHHGVLVL
jgi:cation diffusion facilitator family transporter